MHTFNFSPEVETRLARAVTRAAPPTGRRKRRPADDVDFGGSFVQGVWCVSVDLFQ